VKIESDIDGKMKADALEEAILNAKKNGFKPFFVGATAGTTVIGAYDPFVQIADICDRHGLWHHVDGCWGGSAMLSSSHRHNLVWANRADSYAWNPHKMCGAVVQCSAFVTRHPHILSKVNNSHAAYLFQPDKLHTELDLGDKTIQCSRKADAFKLWMLWKSKGDLGLSATIDRSFSRAEFMANWIREEKRRDGSWELAYEPSCTNVCFWYIPRRLRPVDIENCTEETWHELHAVAPRIKDSMQRAGDAMIGFQSVNGKPNFFRMVFAAVGTLTDQEIVLLLRRMADFGENTH